MFNFPQAANCATLHWESNDKKRTIYMVRSRADYLGTLHEENRTAFQMPQWRDSSKKQWSKLRDNFLAEIKQRTEQFTKDTGSQILSVE